MSAKVWNDVLMVSYQNVDSDREAVSLLRSLVRRFVVIHRNLLCDGLVVCCEE